MNSVYLPQHKRNPTETFIVVKNIAPRHRVSCCGIEHVLYLTFNFISMAFSYAADEYLPRTCEYTGSQQQAENSLMASSTLDRLDEGARFLSV